MNIISFILTVIAVVIFALASRGHQYGSLGLGLAIWATAWALQILWTTRTINL